MPKKSKPRLVRVEWRDAQGWEGWHEKGTVGEWVSGNVAIATTSGFLLRDDADCIVLASSENEDNWGDLTKIPRAMVVKVEQLRSVRGKVNEEKPKPP